MLGVDPFKEWTLQTHVSFPLAGIPLDMNAGQPKVFKKAKLRRNYPRAGGSMRRLVGFVLARVIGRDDEA